MKTPIKIFYTNNELEIGVRTIARNMVKDDCKPDLVVGVLRGGSIPAVYLSHWFGCEMTTMPWSTRDGLVSKIVCKKMIDYLIAGKVVLMVDDIVDSGVTFDEIYDEIKSELSKNDFMMEDVKLKSAALHYNMSGTGRIAPDYYHVEINKYNDPSWIIYPWETF